MHIMMYWVLKIFSTIAVNNSGGIGIRNDLSFVNNGTITVNNTSGNGIYNVGTITNNSGSTITVKSGGYFVNSGIIYNSGKIANKGGTFLNHGGSINNLCGGRTSGKITNIHSGTITKTC